MKKTILYFVAIFTVLITYSCGNQSPETAVDTVDDSTTKTRALPQNEKVQDGEDASIAYITRKWELGEEYIDLDADGSFDAIFEGKHVKGRWGMTAGTDDLRMLKLIGKEEGATDNANTFNRTYELIDLSYDRLVAVDADGHKISFFPEK